ncbi:MAG TPA: type II toxin-antitoxin system prevent-host-death family antitoxin [Pyrinomonadaceae bacterium]|nr:type II toxin-antitoxin system prevent-host-death family antitoxin [Pyrinomonadaceae bacterium]
MTYTVKEAKDKLSSLIRLAEKGQPQVIKRHEKDVAVVLSIEEWKKLGGKKKSLLEFLQDSGLEAILDDLDNRPQDLPREISFD